MRVPLSWLKEFINVDLTPHQIAKSLTQIGLEVDSVENISPPFEGVVIGKVTQVARHPDADKLCIASVSDGLESFQVVCGASNCREGIRTAFAKIGAKLKDGEGKEFKIKKSKLRGIESFGMLCAADELGLGTGSHGIMEFADHLKEGMDVADLYRDCVFEISLTPNLSHCASVLGVARELSSLLGIPLNRQKIDLYESSESIESQVEIENRAYRECPRYMARLIKNVKVLPSPEWMQNRLKACGIRPVNNIVDITNYVLLEYGHPMHAFDFDVLDGKKIVIKTAQEGEVFKTLDDKERILKSDDLLICDASKAVAIAGVMGGENSEVKDSTKNILLECAYFSASSIRKTSKKLGLSTDASKRFERGTDPNQLKLSLDRAAQLIKDLAEGEVVKGVLDETQQLFCPKKIECRLEKINQMLGTKLSLGEVEKIFQRLNFKAEAVEQKFVVTVPTYRVDICQEIDLIEEVARIHGYDKIPSCDPKFAISKLEHSPIFLFERESRQRLIAEGLQELLTCDLIGPSLLKIVQPSHETVDAYIKIMNPTSIEQSLLRTSLLPGLLQVVKYNMDHQNFDLSGFEIGRIHFQQENQFKEQSVVGIILTGKRQPHDWSRTVQDADFYDLKGIVESFLNELNISEISFQQKKLEIFHPGRQASVFAGSLEVGSFGEVHPQIVRRLDVAQKVYFAELNLHDLYQMRHKNPKMKPLPKFPSSDRDWTITVDEALNVGEILQSIKNIPSKLLETVYLLDIYRSDKLGPSFKNVTLRFIYRDNNKTLEQEKVDAEHNRITHDSLNLIKR